MLDPNDPGLKAYLDYVSQNKLLNGHWKVSKSELSGRGLFATRNLPSGALLFKEPPLVLGPRDDPRCPPVCVGCHQTVSTLRLCANGCGLPICSAGCQTSPRHSECATLKNVATANMRQKIAMVAPLRSLMLDSSGRLILGWLEGHARQTHDLVLNPLLDVLSSDQLTLVQKCCQVLDATAYETPCGTGSVRGLYPTAALMNHNCSPNTRHCFDASGNMVVETTRSVLAGEELFVSYTSTIWGTCARQNHLQASKKFHCKCLRCLDTTEFGSRLTALYCLKKDCTGVLLRNTDQHWSCTQCGSKMSAHKIDIIHRAMGTALAKLAAGNPREACRVLLKNNLVPGSNHIAVSFKLSLVRLYGHEDGFMWSQLRMEDLKLKCLLCNELLILLTLLRLGQCRQRGFLLLELVETLQELRKRGCTESGYFEGIHINNTMKQMYQEAASILKYDARAAQRLDANKRQVEAEY